MAYLSTERDFVGHTHNFKGSSKIFSTVAFLTIHVCFKWMFVSNKYLIPAIHTVQMLVHVSFFFELELNLSCSDIYGQTLKTQHIFWLFFSSNCDLFLWYTKINTWISSDKET